MGSQHKTNAAPHGGNTAARLDTTRMAGLLLRDATHHVEVAVRNISAERKAALIASVGASSLHEGLSSPAFRSGDYDTRAIPGWP